MITHQGGTLRLVMVVARGIATLHSPKAHGEQQGSALDHGSPFENVATPRGNENRFEIQDLLSGTWRTKDDSDQVGEDGEEDKDKKTEGD